MKKQLLFLLLIINAAMGLQAQCPVERVELLEEPMVEQTKPALEIEFDEPEEVITDAPELEIELPQDGALE